MFSSRAGWNRDDDNDDGGKTSRGKGTGSTVLLKFCLVVILFLLSGWPAALLAQDASENKTPDEPPPIQDNSFLIEEAYNQEPGIVQHVNTFMRQRGGDWAYSFTQEWPFFSQRHQLSYTVPVQRIGNLSGGSSITTGVGDVALTYRYQMLGVGGGKVAVAPRLTVLLPAGDERRDLGAGGTGVQVNLPVSVALSRRFVTHSNAGATFTPSAKNALGDKAHTKDYNLGQSLVWLAAPKANLLLEFAYSSTESVVGAGGRKEREHELLLNPGVRFAIDLPGGLQIVPGIAVPFGVGPSHGERGVFLYLSFEHSFRKKPE